MGREAEGGDRSIGWDGRERRGPRRQEVGEEVDGLDEVTLGGQHHEVDSVEVLFTAEAAAQIGLGIDGGQRLTATRADEAETSLPAFAVPVQMVGDDTLQGDLVPQAIEQFAGEVLGHEVVLSKSQERWHVGSVREVGTR